MVHAARNGFFYALDRTNGSFVAGKQYVDQLNWTPGLDPKTGRPLNYDPAEDVQIYNEGSHGTRAKPLSARCCAQRFQGGKNWEPSAYNPETRAALHPSIEGCNFIETVEQKDMVDQGGAVEAPRPVRRRRAEWPDALYGSLKAVDPVTGETKASREAHLPELRRRAGDRRQPRVPRPPRRHLRAYDAKTLQEVWSFNAGTGINAPPITYSVNGKQYVAVLVGSRQPTNIMPTMPELKNTSTASMLFVFSL